MAQDHTGTLPRWVATETVLYRVLGDEVLLLDLDAEEYIGLDPVAARFWILLASGADVDAVVATLLNEFAADEQTIRHDLDAFADQMVGRGLLRRG